MYHQNFPTASLHFVRSRDKRFLEIEIHKTVQNILKLIDYWVVVMGEVKTGASLCGMRMAGYRLDLRQKGCTRHHPSDAPDGCNFLV